MEGSWEHCQSSKVIPIFCGAISLREPWSRPIQNPYFDFVSEDPMLTGSPNQENEQVFRWFRTCFSDENSQIKQKKILSIKIRSETPIGGGSWSFGPNPKFLGFLLKGSLISWYYFREL